MVEIKQTQIPTADFEREVIKAINKVDELKHTTGAAKDEVKKLLQDLRGSLVKYKAETIEIPECLIREFR